MFTVTAFAAFPSTVRVIATSPRPGGLPVHYQTTSRGAPEPPSRHNLPRRASSKTSWPCSPETGGCSIEPYLLSQSLITPFAPRERIFYSSFTIQVETGRPELDRQTRVCISVAMMRTNASLAAATLLSLITSSIPAQRPRGVVQLTQILGRPTDRSITLSVLAPDDLDVFVESIPFDETRNYVKRVLASQAAYTFLYANPAFDAFAKLPLRLAP